MGQDFKHFNNIYRPRYYAVGMLMESMFLVRMLAWFMIFSCFVFVVLGNGILYAQSFYGSDRQSLEKFLMGLERNDTLHSNWTGPQCGFNHSLWIGVTCFNGRVTELNLQNMGLSGKIQDTSLLGLTELKLLSLRNNGISGHLPLMSNLLNLESIDFSHNRFSGHISDLCIGRKAKLRKISLSHNRLSGRIPSCFSQLAFLTELTLENNKFTGTIPVFSQETLKIFNVSNNKLFGPIPNTTVMTSFGKSCFSGNPGLCGKPLNYSCASYLHSSEPSPIQNCRQNKINVSAVKIISVIIGCSIIIAILVFLCYKVSSKKLFFAATKVDIEELCRCSSFGCNREHKSSKKIVFLEAGRPDLEIHQVLSASAELLGSGSFASTYKVSLSVGQVLVVKRLPKTFESNMRSFEQRMQFLGTMRHKNLVPVIAYYYSKEEKLIIYPYMPRGSIYDRLIGCRGTGHVSLDWKSRIKIAFGIVRGLSYLHRNLEDQAHMEIPHGDLKLSNVLLRQDNEPVLCDYGLATFATSRKTLRAYNSPEYLHSKTISPKSDVWSLGILLLELLTGKVHCHCDSELGFNLPKWVKFLDLQSRILEVLDLELTSSRRHNEGAMVEFLQLALVCAEDEPNHRPSLCEVMEKIGEIYAATDCRRIPR